MQLQKRLNFRNICKIMSNDVLLQEIKATCIHYLIDTISFDCVSIPLAYTF